MKNLSFELLDKIDLDILKKYHDDKLIDTKRHLTENLLTHNYSRKAQYEDIWDAYTLSCRGLITDLEGNIVSRPLSKFFNMSQLQPTQIPKDKFKVYEKLDGSCIITYLAPKENKYFGATRGSFTSDQAINASRLLQESRFQDWLQDYKEYTFIFEYVAPTNRIVVNYEKEDLILLAIIHNETGKELPIESFGADWNRAKLYEVGSLEELSQREINSEEGTVIKFDSGFRMKAKNKEYVRLHRILTQFSNKDIWECLKEGRDLSQFLDNVPDEFDTWVRKTVAELQEQYEKILEPNKNLYEFELKEITNRRKLAETIMEKQKFDKNIMPSVCFSLYDGKDPSRPIWDLIKPTYQRPFTEDVDG